MPPGMKRISLTDGRLGMSREKSYVRSPLSLFGTRARRLLGGYW